MRELTTDFRRARRLTSGGGTALAISVLVHTAVAVTVGAGVRAGTQSPAPHQESVDVDVVPALVAALAPALNVPGEPAVSSAGPSPMARATRVQAPQTAKARPRRPASDARVDSPAAIDDAAPPIPRFVLAVGTVATRGTVGPPAPSSSISSSISSTSGGGARSEDTVTEGEVDAPARLLSTSPLVYPSAARRAEIELDLPLEIVVDTDGRVLTARALARAGFGLDEAALRAIRLYRFSPAVRAGRPVRVRMRWPVQFRLR